jgi:hypothetical protein
MCETLLHDSYYSDNEKRRLEEKYKFLENYQKPAVSHRATQSNADGVSKKKEQFNCTGVMLRFRVTLTPGQWTEST